MKIIFAILPGCLFLFAEGKSIRNKRDGCDNANYKFGICTRSAYQNYISQLQAGDDGRPDFYARKSCNYLTEAVEMCSEAVEHCYDSDEMTSMKDDQMAHVLDMVKGSIKEWDPEKCPAVKAHLDRVKAKNIDEYEDVGDENYEDYASWETDDDFDDYEEDDDYGDDEEGDVDDYGDDEEGDDDDYADEEEEEEDEDDDDDYDDDDDFDEIAIFNTASKFTGQFLVTCLFANKILN